MEMKGDWYRRGGFGAGMKGGQYWGGGLSDSAMEIEGDLYWIEKGTNQAGEYSWSQ